MRALVLVLLLGCQPAPLGYPMQPVDAAESTFRLDVTMTVDATAFGQGTVELEATATAWIAATDKFQSYLVTAGHACHEGFLTIQGVPLPVTSKYNLVAQDGRTVPALLVSRTDEPDLCLLVSRPLGPALRVSSADPTYDEPMAYVGAPSGVYGDGMAPLYRGYYAGGNLVSIPTAPGASGSAVFTSRGVVGVLVRVGARFNGLTWIEPRAHLVALLDSI